MKFSNISIVIPALNPTETLEATVAELIAEGFDDIIIVNDGSKDEYKQVFERLKTISQCTVLEHVKNLGKGAALKTAFSLFEKTRTGQQGVITADSDGQHKTQDIIKCAAAMFEKKDHIIMGMRNFEGAGVPKRSSLGNRLTASVLQIFFGVPLRDTQTGLRGIPAPYIPFMCAIPGSRFEYETNMLLEVRNRDIPFWEVPIETIYTEGSTQRSDFRPLADSARIIIQMVKYSMSSLTCFLIDIGIFTLAVAYLGDYFGAWKILCATVLARLISSFTNFNINRHLIFKKESAYTKQLIRYASLVVVQMFASAGGLWLLSLPYSGARPTGNLAMLKALLDLLLFFISYYIQHNWVFKKKSKS